MGLGEPAILPVGETDRHALTWTNSIKDHNSCLTHWYLLLQTFKFSIRHSSGHTNMVTVYFSRLPHIANLREEGDGVTESICKYLYITRVDSGDVMVP